MKQEELVAAVEAEEKVWLSTDDIHPYKSRVPQTKGNTVSFPKITKINTFLLHHYTLLSPVRANLSGTFLPVTVPR